MTGEVGLDGKVLIVEKIHVVYTLKIAADQRETAERVHGFHADYCPIARTIKDSVAISTELNMVD